MGFKNIEKKSLYKVATEEFGVEISESATKQAILEALEKDGVTWDMYLNNHPEVALEELPAEQIGEQPKLIIPPEPADTDQPLPIIHPGENIVRGGEQTSMKPVTKQDDRDIVSESTGEASYLIYMDRDNESYSIGDVKFTKQHPFAVVDREMADYILQEEGFRLATPKQATDYYN